MKIKPDPKYIGVPNICFSLTTKTDSREPEYSKDRIDRGFDDSETWSLDLTFANFMIPRLKRFIEIKEQSCDKKYIKDLKFILKTLKMIVKDEGACDFLYDPKQKQKVEKGLKLLSDNFLSLWW
jgi:hypothetical protein